MQGKQIGLAILGAGAEQVTVNKANLAAQVGPESIWLTDSPLICRELYVTLADCAVTTTRFRLATGVSVP